MAAFNVGTIEGYLDLKGAAQFQRAIAEAQKGLGLTGTAATRTAGALSETEAALAGAGRQASLASSGTAKFRAAQLTAFSATERLTTLLQAEGVSMGRLATAEAAVIRANERVAASAPTAALRSSAVAADTSGRAMTGLVGRMRGVLATTAKLGLAMGGFEAVIKGVELVKAGADFQRTMTLISTNANAGTAEIDRLQGSVLQLAGTTATAPEDLATSLYHVEQNGLRGAAALDVVETAAKGAKVGMADVEATTNSMTAAVVSGIPGVQNLDQAMGALIATVGTGDMKMQDLNEALGTGALASLKTYGLSLQDVGAALAVFGDNNLRGAEAMTSLRQAVQFLAKPAAQGKDAIHSIGLEMDTLGKDMQTGGLPAAIDDLTAHMQAAGVTGNKVGQFLVTAFGKKAGVGLATLVDQVGRFHTKLDELDQGANSFASKWDETTKTASFGFQKLGAEAQAAGIAIFNKVGPAAGDAASWLGDKLPAAVKRLQDVLGPLVHAVGDDLGGAWHGVVATLKVAGSALDSISGFLADHKQIVKGVGGAVLSMWVAWKGYTIVRSAIHAVQDALAAIAVAARNSATSMKAAGLNMEMSLLGPGQEAALTSRIMQAEFASIEAAALKAAAAVDRAAAMEAVAFADMTAASSAASDAQVAAAETASTAALAQARATQLAADAAVVSAAEMEAAATAAADTIVTEGAVGAGGWMAMLGPIGLVAGAVALFTTMLHGNDGAAKAAKSAMDSYKGSVQETTDALGEANREQTRKNLADANAVGILKSLHDANKLLDVSLGDLELSTDAGGTALKSMQDRLRGAGGAGVILADVLGTLNTGLTDQIATQKALNDASSATSGSTNVLKLAQADLSTVIDGTTQSMTDQKSAVDTLNEVLAELSGDSNSAAEAQLSLEDSLHAITQQVKDQAKTYKDAGTSLNHNTEEGRKNLEWLHQQIDGINSVASAQAKAGVSTDVITAKMGKNEAALKKAAVAAGLNGKQVQALLDKYAAAPADVKTDMSANTEKADAAVDLLKQTFAGMKDQKVTVTVVAPNVYRVQREVKDAFGEPIYQTVVVDTVHGTTHPGVAHHADGGTVRGPGSGTSDSVPIMASDGEEVINAKQAGKHRGLLKAINAGVDGFASGGTVKSTSKTDTLTISHGGVTGVASWLKGQKGAAAAASRDLAKAVDDAFQLKGVEKQLDKAKQTLTDLRQKIADFKTGVTGGLTSGFDVSKYGSIADLVSGLGGNTATSKNFTADFHAAAAHGINKSLLDQLAASGDSATLQSLAGASKSDAARVNKAFGANQAALRQAGNVAANDVYGGEYAKDKQNVARLVNSQERLYRGVTRFVAAIGRATNQPAEITLDGHVVSKTVIKSHEFQGALNDLTHHLQYG